MCSWRSTHTRWLLGVASLCAMIKSANCALAQITPDTTLPNNSRVNPVGNTGITTIEAGTQAGSNLFHSFQQFSVPRNSTAHFNNSLNIQNIISRVTGGSISNIDGIIQANGTANLFLINPSGIVFGPHASLNVGGSFVSTTANAIQFGNQGLFSADVPNSPALLTVNPSALFFNQIAAPIRVSAGTDPAGSGGIGLRVPDGKSLLLVGGNINIDGGQLNAKGGRVELGGLAAPGTVGLQINGNNLSLRFPASTTRADVSVTNGASVDVTDGGSIVVNARNIDILGGSTLKAGIAKGLGSESSVAGDITLDATGVMTINQASRVSNTVAEGAIGNAGNINIKAGDISITNLASDPALDASSSGLGRSGNVFLEATNGSISVTGQDKTSDDQVISTFSQKQALGSGNISLIANGTISLNNAYFVTSSFGGEAGSISLQGNKSVTLANNSSLVSTAFGSGISGNITLESSGPVSLQRSLVSTAVGDSDATSNNPKLGNAGNITISGRSVSVTDGAEVSSRTFNGGRSGDILVNATDTVEISGRSPLLPRPDNDRAKTYVYSVLTTSTESRSRDVAGDIKVTTGKLRVSDGASLTAESRGDTRGGSIDIHANKVELTGGGQLLTTAFGKGDAGNITLNVKDGVVISGSNSSKAAIFTLIADTFTQDELGQKNDDGSPKYTPAQAQADGIRTALGFVDIAPSRPEASGIFANTSTSTSATSSGKGGDLTIATGQLVIQDNAQVSVSSQGLGNAGNLKINARSVRLDNNATLSADKRSINTVPSQEQATITINSRDLILGGGSNITTNATGSNVIGGNINIDTDVLAAVENSKISANSTNSRGGRVVIKNQGIFLSSDSKITATGARSDLSGTVQINTPDIDPSRGLVKLPTSVVDIPRLISSSCAAFFNDPEVNSFTLTGRGGLPPSPDEPLSPDAVWSDTRLTGVDSKVNNRVSTTTPQTPLLPKQETAIVPATGWVFNGKGEVTLISSVPHSTRLDSIPASCP